MAKTTTNRFANVLLATVFAAVFFAAAAACGKAAGTGQNEFRDQPEPVISFVNSEANKMELWGGGDVKPGNWGGQGIAMVVEKSSATIEFDCANATINSRMRIKGGKFTVTGLLTRAGPGPVRLGFTPKAQEVLFEGKVTGKQMTMTVKFVESGEVIGKYSLEQDKPAKLRRCL